MWRTLASFEIRYHMGQPLAGVSMVLFFFLGVGLAASDVGAALGDAPGTTLRNAPIVLLRLMPVLGLLGLFAVTAFVASSALRDFDTRSDALFFTKPISRWDYLAGRFVGSMSVSLLVLLAGVAGLVAGHFMPWQPTDRLGPFSLVPFLQGVLVLIVPNLLTMGALFFALAIWSRRATVTYLGLVFFIGMQDATEIAGEGLDGPVWRSLIEPTGLVALETLTQYWTVAEQNHRLPELSGLLLANRLVWLGLALGILALASCRFDLAPRERSDGKRRRGGSAEPTSSEPAPRADETPALPTALGQRPTSRRPSLASRWRQLLRQTRLELSEVVARAPFLGLLALGLLFTVAYSLMVGLEEGMPPLPLTALMVQAIELGVRLSLVVILGVYAGELVFHHRSLRLSQVYDALPIPSGLLLTAKVLTLVAIVGLFLATASLSTFLVQLGKGFLAPDLGLYAPGLVVVALPLLPVILLALFLQVVANHKRVGFLLTALVLLARWVLPRLGFEDNLYLYGGHPKVQYSVFNGYGHHLEGFAGFMVYWGLGGGLLLLATFLLWPRGTETSWAARLRMAWHRSTPSVVIVGLLGMVAMGVVGSWLYDQTHRQQEYLDRDRQIERLAEYEQAYRTYAALPLPRVTSVFAEVALFPSQRRLEVRGRYRIENRGTDPIRMLPITMTPRWVEGALPVYGGVTLERLDLPDRPGHRRVVDDAALGFYVVELAEPLAAGESTELEFVVRVDHGGLANKHPNDLIVANGTFFTNREFFPFLGYSENNQLQSPTERRKRGLPPVVRAADLDDVEAREHNYLEADWIDFETILSTEADQIALSSGELVREWTEGDRRIFHYRSGAPVVNLVPFMSGRYAVARGAWQGIGIEVYHHPDHGFNIEHFLEVARRSLAYFSAEFGPYPHDTLRIVEIPSYHGKIAFSLAQMIPFSESWTFTADLDAAELDWLAAILAHEVAHQWWNHQVVPGNVQGATLIAESLCQYSATRILDQMHGPEMVRQFLRVHRRRYLEQRGSERVREMPLARVENQGYLHYSKASLAFAALEEAMGETALNRALRAFRDENVFRGPPYATSRDLLSHIRRVAGDEHQALIHDLFETITVSDDLLLADDLSILEPRPRPSAGNPGAP